MTNKALKKKMLGVLGALGFFAAGLSSYPFLIDGQIATGISQPNPLDQKASTAPPAVSLAKSEIEDLRVCFTPTQSCLPQILQYLDKAKSNILLLGYSFTSKPITDALIKAKHRGVKIRIVLDRSQRTQKSSKEPVAALLENQIEVRFDHSVKIAHNKVMVIDDYQTITGSYNWSHAAEFNNAENLVFIRSQAVAKKYTDYFEGRWKVSQAFSKVK